MALLQGKLADACDVSRIRIRRVLVKNGRDDVGGTVVPLSLYLKP